MTRHVRWTGIAVMALAMLGACSKGDQGASASKAPAARGKTWYPFGFMSEIERNEPGISSGIAVIHGLIDQAAVRGIKGLKK